MGRRGLASHSGGLGALTKVWEPWTDEVTGAVLRVTGRAAWRCERAAGRPSEEVTP